MKRRSTGGAGVRRAPTQAAAKAPARGSAAKSPVRAKRIPRAAVVSRAGAAARSAKALPRSAAGAAAEARPRTRRSAAEAQRRILEAAERALMRVGPEGLRLTDLARELRVSHPAILHHFGSREGLVAAVVTQAMSSLSADLIAALTSGPADRDALMDMVAEVCSGRGFARLSAWLLLSDRVRGDVATPDAPLKRLAEAAHSLRARHNSAMTYEDTLFELQLVATALLGDALFGAAVRGASGVADTPEASRDFRRRLARLLPER
jgi:AcrR family transcriptional regulator